MWEGGTLGGGPGRRPGVAGPREPPNSYPGSAQTKWILSTQRPHPLRPRPWRALPDTRAPSGQTAFRQRPSQAPGTAGPVGAGPPSPAPQPPPVQEAPSSHSDQDRPAHTWPWLCGRVQTPCALRGAPAPQSGSVRASAYKVPSWAQGLSQHPLCPCPCPRLGSASTGLHMTHTPGPWSGCAHVDPMLSFAGSPSSHTHTHSHSRWLPDQLL